MYSIRTKIKQLFIAGFNGPSIKNNEIFVNLLKDGLGGVIFFTQNIVSQEQVCRCIEDIKNVSLIMPFISIDQEGGRVERTENIHGGKKYLSAKDAAQKGMYFLCNQTRELCEELVSYGFNMNFAPVLDTNTNPDNPIIGVRAYGDTPNDVIKFSDKVIDIHKKYNLIAVGKHFPGHGDTKTDSHIEMPIVDLSKSEMEQTHLMPFEHAINNGIDAIMVAHVYYTCFDGEPIPASLSKNVITKLLRNELNFDGLVISDDMVMGAVNSDGDNTQTYIKALKSGINMFIYRYSDTNLEKILYDIENLAQNDNELFEAINRSYQYVMTLKDKYRL